MSHTYTALNMAIIPEQVEAQKCKLVTFQTIVKNTTCPVVNAYLNQEVIASKIQACRFLPFGWLCSLGIWWFSTYTALPIDGSLRRRHWIWIVDGIGGRWASSRGTGRRERVKTENGQLVNVLMWRECRVISMWTWWWFCCGVPYLSILDGGSYHIK
jgi:hypothetical protein